MQLIIFTGVQASGKSTFYKHYFYDTHLRINLDMLKTRRRENILFEAALRSKTKMVIDNTNMTIHDRERYIQRAKDADFDIVSFYFETDLESTLHRNTQREGKANIPEQGVKATFYKLQKPTSSEGFNALFKVKLIENDGFSILTIND